MKNQFLFFDKGKKQQSKNVNSLLSGLFNNKTDESENYMATSSILRRNSVTDVNNAQNQPLSLVLEKNPLSLMSMNESQLLTEKAKLREIMKYKISPREDNFLFKKNSLNKNGLLKIHEHKKLVDPLKFKVIIVFF